MLASQKVAIAAHLHVLLRRKTGRVTDTEWMAENLDYAREIIRFSRAKAIEEGQPDLADWADKLARALNEPAGLGIAAAHSQPIESGFAESVPANVGAAPGPAVPRYVGGIR